MTKKLLFHVVISALISQGQEKDQLDGVRLYLGNTSGPWNYGQAFRSDPSSGTPLIQYVFKPHNVIARFISLMRQGYILTICEVTVEGECRRGTYGSGCNEICGNCYKVDSSCSVNDGRCMEGCEAGWHGATCKLRVFNFALHKSASQSTTLNFNNFNWTADKAVDGNSNGDIPETSRTCSATIHGTADANHIWEVDIGVQIIVKTITVYGRTDAEKDQLDGVRLYLGNTSGPWNYGQAFSNDPSSGTPLIRYVFKPHNVIARFISLMRVGYILTICEVTVEGECRRGTYGPGCNEKCGNWYKGDNGCSLTDGKCMEGCETGWRGDTCKLKCEPGTYGFNCNETCGYCLNGNNCCSQTNGQCSIGCEPGWKGETCKSECEVGTYGFNCNETCGYCLNGNNSCSKVSGQCRGGCQTGWKGETCKSECEVGTYGFNCDETCGYCLNGNNSCSKISGQCSGGCQAGWKDETCKSDCEAGTYGFHCNITCGYCLNGNTSCSMISGQCSGGCQTGWRGDACKSECEVGTYGFNCNETCGYCLNGNDSCSKISGQCRSGCQSGWRGETCKSGMLEMVTPGDVGPNVGAIVGSVLAAVGVSVSAMVIIIVIVKKRKRNNNETSTENVTPATHYANLVVGNSERETAFSATEEASLQKGMPIRATNSHNGVMEPDVPVHNDYEKLRAVTESTESAYYPIDHDLIKTPRYEEGKGFYHVRH